jgi:hypothetical protein
MEVKGKTLALLTASFILFNLSFTLSSCKDCGKERTKPADRDNKVSMLGDDNKAPVAPEAKLTLLDDIEVMVKDVAGCVYTMLLKTEKEMVVATRELEKLTKGPVVAEAEKSEVEDIVIRVKVIKLLLARAETIVTREAYWVAAIGTKEEAEAKVAVNKATATWRAKRDDATKANVLRIAKAAFVRAAVDKGDTDTEPALERYFLED